MLDAVQDDARSHTGDVTVAELAIEALYPADDRTRAHLMAAASPAIG